MRGYPTSGGSWPACVRGKVDGAKYLPMAGCLGSGREARLASFQQKDKGHRTFPEEGKPKIGVGVRPEVRMPAFVLWLSLAASGPVDIARRVARTFVGELHVDRGRFGWLPRPAQRIVAAEALEVFHCCAARNLQWRPDRSGCHAIHPDGTWPQLLCQRLMRVTPRTHQEPRPPVLIAELTILSLGVRFLIGRPPRPACSGNTQAKQLALMGAG